LPESKQPAKIEAYLAHTESTPQRSHWPSWTGPRFSLHRSWSRTRSLNCQYRIADGLANLPLGQSRLARELQDRRACSRSSSERIRL